MRRETGSGGGGGWEVELTVPAGRGQEVEVVIPDLFYGLDLCVRVRVCVRGFCVRRRGGTEAALWERGWGSRRSPGVRLCGVEVS